MSAGKAVSRSVALVLVAVTVILSASTGGLVYYYRSTIDSKDQKISELNSQISELNSRLASLNSDKLNLQSQVASLRDQLARAMSERDSLERQITLLRSQIDQLNSQIVQLKAQIDYLKSIIELRLSKTFDTNRPVAVSASSYVTLQYSTPYAGYLRVDFTSTGGVYFVIGGDFIGGSYARYPQQGTANFGSFIVPVLPGTTYIQIVNPSFFFGVSVVVTVTYVY